MTRTKAVSPKSIGNLKKIEKRTVGQGRCTQEREKTSFPDCTRYRIEDQIRDSVGLSRAN